MHPGGQGASIKSIRNLHFGSETSVKIRFHLTQNLRNKALWLIRTPIEVEALHFAINFVSGSSPFPLHWLCRSPIEGLMTIHTHRQCKGVSTMAHTTVPTHDSPRVNYQVRAGQIMIKRTSTPNNYASKITNEFIRMDLN